MSRRILYIVALAALLVPVTNTVYIPNIPVIQKDLGTTTQLIALTISVFTGMMALSQLIYGPLSDRHGRRGVLVFGLLVYAVSSFVIYLSNDVYQLIALRVVQAFGASAGVVVGAAVISDVYKRGLGGAMGTYQSVILIGPLIGPVIGGITASLFGWRAIFLLLTLLGLAAFTMVYFLLGETMKKRHSPHPMASLKLLKSAPLFSVSFLGFAMLATAYAFFTFLPFMLHSLGFDTAIIGLVFLPSGIALYSGSKVAGKLLNNRVPKIIIIAGSAFFIFSIVAFAFSVSANLGVYVSLAIFTLANTGAGMFWTAARVYVVQSSRMKASANGAFNFMSFLGATMAPFAGSLVFESFGLFTTFAGFAALTLVALLAVARKA